MRIWFYRCFSFGPTHFSKSCLSAKFGKLNWPTLITMFAVLYFTQNHKSMNRIVRLFFSCSHFPFRNFQLKFSIKYFRMNYSISKLCCTEILNYTLYLFAYLIFFLFLFFVTHLHFRCSQGTMLGRSYESGHHFIGR